MQYSNSPAGGLEALASAFLRGSDDKARRGGYLETMQGFSTGMQGRERAAKAMIEEDRLKGRQGLSRGLGAALPGGPEWGPLATLIFQASDNLTPQGAAEAIGRFKSQGRLDRAVETAPTDPTQAAWMMRAGGEEEPDLYTQNAAGQVLNTVSGRPDTSSGLAQAAIAAANALAGERGAHAGLYRAQTGTEVDYRRPYLTAQTEAAGRRGMGSAAARGAGGGPDPFKSSDSNAIANGVAALFGDKVTFNPLTGQFSALDRTVSVTAAEIAARAEELFMQAIEAGTPIGHRTAVLQASRERGLGAVDPPGAAADPSDPEGIRRFVLGE